MTVADEPDSAHDPALSSHNDPAVAGAQAVAVGAPGTRPQDAERRALADRITEDVMQLLYTARQDLAELAEQGTDYDPKLLRSANDCTSWAIAILRGVASTVLGAAWGPSAGVVGPDEPASTASALFDALDDAWMITCEDDDLLYASRAACDVLEHSPQDLAELLRRPDGWPRRLAEVPRSADPSDTVEFGVDVPLRHGGVRTVHVVSHPLPSLPGGSPSYISRLTDGGVSREP